MSGTGECNPNYRAYSRAHGMSPDDMLAHDMQRWPGGCMAGFIVWIGEQRAVLRRAHPEAFVSGNVVDETAWLAWLEDSR